MGRYSHAVLVPLAFVPRSFSAKVPAEQGDSTGASSSGPERGTGGQAEPRWPGIGMECGASRLRAPHKHHHGCSTAQRQTVEHDTPCTSPCHLAGTSTHVAAVVTQLRRQGSAQVRLCCLYTARVPLPKQPCVSVGGHPSCQGLQQHSGRPESTAWSHWGWHSTRGHLQHLVACHTFTLGRALHAVEEKPGVGEQLKGQTSPLHWPCRTPTAYSPALLCEGCGRGPMHTHTYEGKPSRARGGLPNWETWPGSAWPTCSPLTWQHCSSFSWPAAQFPRTLCDSCPGSGQGAHVHCPWAPPNLPLIPHLA